MENNHFAFQSDDILDFLDRVRAGKALMPNGHFDIVDVVKAFFTQENYQPAKMTENVKKENHCQPFALDTSSTVARMSEDPKEDLEHYQYLYEERAAIIQFEWLSPAETTPEFAESEALKEVTQLYAAERQLLINSSEVTEFINQLTIN